MRALTLWVAGSLLFALGGCSSDKPPPATAKRAPGATSGRDFTAAEDAAPVTSDTGARLLAAEPLGALVVHTVPTLGPALGPTTSATMERPGAPEPLAPPASQPVYRPPTWPARVPIAPPPPPPPPPAFPAPVKPSTPQSGP
jgi:hypothetical protein